MGKLQEALRNLLPMKFVNTRGCVTLLKNWLLTARTGYLAYIGLQWFDVNIVSGKKLRSFSMPLFENFFIHQANNKAYKLWNKLIVPFLQYGEKERLYLLVFAVITK